MLSLTGVSLAVAAPRVDFGSQIRPLLSDRCFSCHGPAKQKGGLRLDLEADVLRPRKDGVVILKRAAPRGQSELYRRIRSAVADDRMPPEESHLSLTEDQIALIGRWIEEGAPFAGHWAFLAPKAIPVPRVAAAPRGLRVNPVDAFVWEAAVGHSLKPAPEAPRAVLLQRLSFDLTGLPATTAQIAAFRRDRAPNAYERQVDRLLHSPHYGEHKAVSWLDLARFSDTYGYQADMDRDLSPYRDWVIRAFNQNLPYDQFLTWQLAGDLLRSPTTDQRIATAFGRLHRQTNEGGSINEEFRTEYVADRVQTMGTAFLGITLECSRCHDHKFDPITQRDYYSLFSFFNSMDESGLYSHFTRATPGPAMALSTPQQETQHLALDAQVAAAEASRATITTPAAPLSITSPPPVVRFPFDEFTKDRTPDVRGRVTCRLADGPTPVPGKNGDALKFSGDNSVLCEDVGVFSRTQPFSIGLWLKPVTTQPRAVVLHRSRAWSDAGSRGYELVLRENRPSFALIHFWPSNAVAIEAQAPLPLNRWSHITLSHDGTGRASGLRIYVDGQNAATSVIRDQLTRDINYRKEWGDDTSDLYLTLGARFRDIGFRGGEVDDLTVFDTELSTAEVRSLYVGGPIMPNMKESREIALRRQTPAYQQAEALLGRLRADRGALEDALPEIMVMADQPKPRPTFVLVRGAYDAPGTAVAPVAPIWLLPFSSSWPRNRLGLANWLTDPGHPLVGRVAVNRAWKTFFGRGLVATPEDFGAQGDAPSHPQLLDHLARRFIDGGWDGRALDRLIVTSATYRQSSRPRADLSDLDPENRWLLRGPRHRLDAEQIRDRVLACSGLLSQTLYGPSVKPYQPAGLWEESGTGKTYVQDHGSALYRRSLYTFWRRTAPPPALSVFDAPTREICVARRERTATPLQALALLNDPQVVEASRVLAEDLVRHHRRVSVRVAEAMRAVLGRAPDEYEQTLLARLFAEQRALFASAPDQARRLLQVGERKADSTLLPVDVAAMSIVVTALFNHDEFVMKR